ncbi:MAG: FecR domain-containing protein, partial [Kofleriaceae bacterium]
MKLVGRVPVEPLDEERLTNIERRLVIAVADRPARTARVASRRHAWVALAVVAAMALFGVGWRLGSTATPAPQLADQAQPLRATTTGTRSVLELGDATITSDPATLFEVTRPGTGVLITLTRGKVELDVAKRGHRAPLIVRAGATDVEVVGTRFTVDYRDGTGDVDVRVMEGVVRVVRSGDVVRVAAGHTWQTGRGLFASAKVAPPSTPPNEQAAPIAASEQGVAIGDAPPPEVLHGRVAHVPDGPAATGSIAIADANRPQHDDRRSHSAGSNARTGAVQDLRTAIRQQPVTAPISIDEPDPQRAIAAYLGLLGQRKSEAPRALYGIAYIQAMKLGKPEDALATLAKVIRFQGGADYTAALWLRVRISCLAAIDERCRQAAHTYARRDP